MQACEEETETPHHFLVIGPCSFDLEMFWVGGGSPNPSSPSKFLSYMDPNDLGGILSIAWLF